MKCPFCKSSKTGEVILAYSERFTKYGEPLTKIKHCDGCKRLFGDKY